METVMVFSEAWVSAMITPEGGSCAPGAPSSQPAEEN